MHITLTDKGFAKMKLHGFNKSDLPYISEVEGVDTSGSIHITYVFFPGIKRKDGRRRFGLIEGDFELYE